MATPIKPPSFPDWYVPNCPPDDSIEADGFVYRFVEKKLPDEMDFKSYHETGERPNGKPCERCGLSVFRSAEDIRILLKHLWKSFPAKTYGQNIVRRKLSDTDGKTKQTGGNGHHTWWAYDGVIRHESFEFIEEVSKD